MEGDAGVSCTRIQEEALLQNTTTGVCLICGDDVGGLFVACADCAFPVCRACFDYERKEGYGVCPQCKTPYKDDSEDGKKLNQQFITEAMLHTRMSYGRGEEENSPPFTHLPPPLLANNRRHISGDYTGISPERRSAASSFIGGRRVHPFPYAESHATTSSVDSRSLDTSREFAPYEFGDVWKDRLDGWKVKQDRMTGTSSMHTATERESDPPVYEQEDEDLQMMDEARQPLSRKVSIASSLINPYRMVIVIRLVFLAFFLKYRIQHPVKNAYPLWLTSVVCEIWFALSWILDQFPKWLPISRETYLDRLSLRFEQEGQPSKLAPVDIYVSTVDPMKEPPLVTANTVLSILAVDYPIDKVSCYVSDDGAAMLTFDSLSETSEFARKWVPFCKRYNIEPRAPEVYFAQKMDYLKDKVQPTFVKDRRAMKREYEEYKVKINALVAKAQKVPDGGWTMQDGTPWPGNNTRDHPGMIQVFLGHSGGLDTEGNELPRLVYVSREKRPGFNHHKKAGAMNALVRVSAVLTNAPFFLNLDCDHYINNSKALREAMCFLMDSTVGKKVCYVQFPQRFDGIDRNDRYANHNTVFFDINLKGLDGIQGPVYVGTGCVFRRQALYGHDAPPSNKGQGDGILNRCFGSRRNNKSRIAPRFGKNKIHSQNESDIPTFNFEDTEEGMEGFKNDAHSQSLFEKFGQSPVFVATTFFVDGGVPESATPSTLLKEAIHVISCGYEDRTEWGKEIGWIYGSVTEDILTGFKMHARGWRSIYCMPQRAAFKGSAPINLSDRLHQVLRWALGSVEIFLSRHCPIWYGYGGRLKWLERLAYINTTIYPLTSLPLLTYCSLPAVCLLTGKFIIPEISNFDSLWFIALFLSIFATGILEMRWSGVGIDEWWRNEQFWVIGGVSAHLFALFQGLLKVIAGIDTNFTVTSKGGDDADFSELYMLKWTTLLIPPTTLLVINLVGVVAGISDAVSTGYQSWGPLFGKLFFAFWVIVHLYPFLKGLMGRQNRTPTIVIVWSVLLASIFCILWVKINPFLIKVQGPSLQLCGINC